MRKIYEDREIAITAEMIESTRGNFAVSDINSVGSSRQSRLAPLYAGAGLLVLIVCGSMTSCGVLFVSAFAGQDMGEWTAVAWGGVLVGLFLLAVARRLPPRPWYVQVQSNGTPQTVYVTASEQAANAVVSAISEAAGTAKTSGDIPPKEGL